MDASVAWRGQNVVYCNDITTWKYVKVRSTKYNYVKPSWCYVKLPGRPLRYLRQINKVKLLNYCDIRGIAKQLCNYPPTMPVCGMHMEQLIPIYTKQPSQRQNKILTLPWQWSLITISQYNHYTHFILQAKYRPVDLLEKEPLQVHLYTLLRCSAIAVEQEVPN